jgi:hypothetical protein
MMRPRAASDFAAIRARIEELRRERAQRARDNVLERTDEVTAQAQNPSANRSLGPSRAPHRR